MNELKIKEGSIFPLFFIYDILIWKLYQDREVNMKIKKVLLYVVTVVIIAIFTMLIYEFATRNNEYYIGEKNLQIPIFTYHHLVQDESEIEMDCMQTTVDKFKSQITGLMKIGYKPITYQELVDYKDGKIKIPKWSFLVTFDDGYDDFYYYVYPIAQELNVPITVFIIDNGVGKDGYLTWEQIKEMNDSGYISVYSHGLEHLEYDKETKEKLVNDLNLAYENLKEKLSKEDMLKVFAYPYGLATDEQIDSLADEGYIENLMDGRINTSKNLSLKALHRCYACSDSALMMIIKQIYRLNRYK